MRVRALRFSSILVVLAAVAGCDHSDNCTDAEAQKLGDVCGATGTFAEFAAQDPLGAAAFGRMRLGTEYAPAIPVRIDLSPGRGGEANVDVAKLLPASQITDDSGFYRFPAAPTYYDLTTRTGREVVALRGLYVRFVEPTIGDDAEPRAFSTHLDVALDPPPPPAEDVRYFVSGDDAAAGSGDLASGATVSFRRFSMQLRLHAVQLAKDDPTKMTAYGFADVGVESGRRDLVRLHLDPTPKAVDLELVAKAPAGTELGSVELVMDLGMRRSAISVVRALVGQHVSIVPVPNARWFAKLRGKIGDAVTDSGLVFFDPNGGNVTIELPAAPKLGDASAGVLTADAKGLREHVLVPLSGEGTSYRVATIDRATRLPDVTGLGAPPPSGTYVWTVRAWPDLATVDALTGPDARVAPRTATSAPKTIVLP